MFLSIFGLLVYAFLGLIMSRIVYKTASEDNEQLAFFAFFIWPLFVFTLLLVLYVEFGMKVADMVYHKWFHKKETE